MPKNASVSERLVWHREHQKACACRPIPPKLMALMPPTSSSLTKTKTKTKTKTNAKAKTTATGTATKAKQSPIREAAYVDPRFVPIIGAFANDRQVTCGGKGFGSSGLKVGGKLFAMISSKGKFVAKLSKGAWTSWSAWGEVSISIPGTEG